MISKLFGKLRFVALALAMAAAFFVPLQKAGAATQNYSTATTGVVVIPLHVSGQYTASTTAVARFTMPFPCKVLTVGASARASGGTSPTLTVDLKAGGVSLLSAPVSVTAGAVAEATISTSTVADEAAMTVDLAITGTSPTWNDITIFITVLRR